MRLIVHILLKTTFAACIVAMFGCASVQVETSPHYGEPEVKRFILDNGMNVFIVENPASRIVTLDAWVKAGAIYEPKELNGISHYLEHMLFKGTEAKPLGELDKIVEGVGGYWNAGTGHDFAHYYLTVAAPFFEVGLDALSDVLMNASLDLVEMEKERLVIIEEYRLYQDNPRSFLRQKVFERSYASSPYKNPVIGTPDTIKGIKRSDLEAYYQRYYAPENISFVVAGGIKVDEALSLIKEKFADFTRVYMPYKHPSTKTNYNAGLRETYHKDVNEAYLVISFPAPSINESGKSVQMDVLQTILGGGRSSRLYQSLREKKQLVSAIEAGYATQKYRGLFAVSAALDSVNVDKAIEAIFNEIEKVADKGVLRKELARAKKILINGHYFSKETSSGQSGAIGYCFSLTGNLDFEEQYVALVQKTKESEVVTIARDLLDRKKSNVFILLPKNEEE